MWQILSVFFVGVVGWFATHFFARQVLRLHELRASAHEALIFIANIESRNADEEAYKRAVHELRRLAARVLALDHSATWLTKRYFRMCGYDLEKAGTRLMGVSNSVGCDYSMAAQRHGVERGLRLPMTYTDVDIERLRQNRLRGR